MALNPLGICLGNKLRFCVKLVRLKKHEKSVRYFSKWIKNHHEVTGRRCFSVIDPNVVKSTLPDIEIPNVPLHEFIFKDVGQWETKVAIECGFSGKTWTYRDLLKISKNLAISFQNKLKLDKGKLIAVVLPNCPEYVAILLACSMTGVIPTTINPIYTATEISLQLKETRPSAIITTPEMYNKCEKVLNLTTLKSPIVIVKNQPDIDTPPGAISFEELTVSLSGEKLEPVAFDSSADYVLPYSSGTSGLPKGVQLSHKNIIANIIQVTEKPTFQVVPDKDTNQRFILGLLPMFHIYGMVVIALQSLSQGDKIVSLPKFEPNLFIDTIWKKKIHTLYLVPPLIFFLGNQPSVESKHLEHTQWIMNGAASCGSKDMDKLLQKASHLKLSQGYGLTETSPVITITDIDRTHKTSSIGSLVPSTEVKIVDQNTGESLPQNKHGELWVKGPQVMKGYYKKPEENDKVFNSDKWFKTGDVAYYDEDKDFFIVDRIKELIKVKGLQVAPAELEEFLRSHEKVSDAGVIGIPHPQYGEVPKAFVVLKEHVRCTEEEIQEYIKASLSSHKQLRGGVTFLKEIPRSTAGKILRKNLKSIDAKS